MKKLVFVLITMLCCISQNVLAYEITVEDRVAIRETISAYGHNFDRRNSDGFAALFKPNGRWDAFINKSPKALISLQGRKEISKFSAERQKMFENVGIETKHFMLNIVITQEAENEVHCSAMAIIMWQRPLHGDPLPRPVQTGYYDYILRKSDQGWKFHQVKVLTSGYYKPSDIYSDLKTSSK